MSNLSNVIQPTAHTDVPFDSPQFNLDYALEDFQIRINSLNELCQKIDHQIPKLNNIVQAISCLTEITIELRQLKGITPNSSNRSQIIECLRSLLKVVELLSKIATFINLIFPNPILTELLMLIGIIRSIIKIIINSYDLINGKGDVWNATIDLISNTAQLLPLTGLNDAHKIQQIIQSSCDAVSSMKRAEESMRHHQNGSHLIRQLAEIERYLNKCRHLADQFSNY